MKKFDVRLTSAMSDALHALGSFALDIRAAQSERPWLSIRALTIDGPRVSV